jgi:hypothetical protein
MSRCDHLVSGGVDFSARFTGIAVGIGIQLVTVFDTHCFLWVSRFNDRCLVEDSEARASIEWKVAL